MKNRLLETQDQISSLAKQLANCPEVQRYSEKAEKEEWTLAHALADIEDSCCKIFEVYLPKIVGKKNENENEIYNTLLDIGEELRHILYHIEDPKFYRYLIEK